jgi:hypothetical protein
MQPLWDPKRFPFYRFFPAKKKWSFRGNMNLPKQGVGKLRHFVHLLPFGHSRKRLAGIHPLSSFRSSITKMDTRHKPRV